MCFKLQKLAHRPSQEIYGSGCSNKYYLGQFDITSNTFVTYVCNHIFRSRIDVVNEAKLQEYKRQLDYSASDDDSSFESGL